MGLLRTVLISIVLTLLLSKYLNQEYPPGLKQPFLTRCFGMGIKVLFDQAWVGHTLSVNGPAWQRRVVDAATVLGSYISPTPKCSHTDMRIEGIPVRMYQPPNKRKGELLRTIIYFHGGGWTVGSIDTYAVVTDRLSHDLNAVVFSVGYRLAPEHVYPAALDDCVTVTKYVVHNAKTYGVDAMRIGVMGDSAGGNLAAAVSLKLRDEKFKPMPKAQILIFPSLQFVNFNTPSVQFNAFAPVLTKRYMVEFGANYIFGHWDHIQIMLANNHTSPDMKRKLSETYLNPEVLPHDVIRRQYEPQPQNAGNASFWSEHESAFLDPYLNPLMADSLKGLPSAYLSSCKHDVLRDDAFFYAHRLKQAKVQVNHVNLNACLHGWLFGVSVIEDFDHYFTDMVGSIAQLL